MKSRITATSLLVLGAACLWCLGSAAEAQEGTIKVTTTIHGDGTRTDMQTNLSERTAESKTYDAGGKLIQRISYKLDDQGQYSEGTVYTVKGSVWYTFTYSRNGRGQIEEELDNSPKGQLIRKLVYHYDSSGHVSGIDTFDAQGRALSLKRKP